MEKQISKNELSFSELKIFEVRNFKNKAKLLRVTPILDKTSISEANINEIIEACNQESIYNILFREKFKGNKYSELNAKQFIDWAVKGWQDRAYFVYLLRLTNGKVVGCIDIKSSNLDAGEIGYWMNCNFAGYMTNAVLGIVKQAEMAGFKTLVAYTKLENRKSKGVLERAGFNYAGQEKKEDNKTFDKYICAL